ncbi:MAG: hypothetical protein GY866_18730, partial [Proteobacteria bacterium]|nr:hypothetical protein [Pseudomonadota bacterium]
GNMQTVELIVLRDKDKIQRLSDLTVDWFQMWGKAAEEEMKRQEEAGGDVDLALYRTARYGTNLSLARSIGRDPIFHKAPAVMIFHSVKRQGSNKDDCMIAATTMSLTARTMGIESTYIGLFESAARDNQEVFEELELPSTHGIYSVMIMGYPRLKYLRTVDRKPIRTQWL